MANSLGPGTSPASGIALLTAALKHLASGHSKVMCTTHFLEILSMGLLVDAENGVNALRMAVQIPRNTNGNALPLFKLEKGVATSSAGLVCARMAGVKQAVIDRAEEIIKAGKNRRQVQPLAEILRDNLNLSIQAKVAISAFVQTDWKTAIDDQVNDLLSMVERMLVSSNL
jgi:DNA mismatch repair protein MSH5